MLALSHVKLAGRGALLPSMQSEPFPPSMQDSDIYVHHASSLRLFSN